MHRLRYFIGLLTLVGAILAAIWMVRLLRSLDDRPGLSLSVEFRNARGLRAGTDVRYRGVTVGTVRSVAISGDGNKAVAQLLLEPTGARHACVNSSFWVVTPRFGGLTGGATGLDTLVRDSYIAFYTPPGSESELSPGSLIAGRERPPLNAEPEALDDVEHGDLLMTLLVPENYELKPGSSVIFRGVPTGDVRSVSLAASGTHVEVKLRIKREHRQTVTDKSKFWVGRPNVSGALLSGFTVTDISALLTPYISYYGAPGVGVLVQDGYRAAAELSRPAFEISPVPGKAVKQDNNPQPAINDDVVLVRVTYSAIERDMLSADDHILRQGSGVLFLDRSGRSVVVTARSLADASFTEGDAWGDPEIDSEVTKVHLANGTVMRAHRVWVAPGGHDLAALVLEDAPPDLLGTPSDRLVFEGTIEGVPLQIRAAGPDGVELPIQAMASDLALSEDNLGGCVAAADKVIGVFGRKVGDVVSAVVPLEHLPADLRPQ
tara:strand:- start:97763 stop:99232 length:1470 start_codon:yes stop_codon:yes gene_type:complete